MTAGARCRPTYGRGRTEGDGSRAEESQHHALPVQRGGTSTQQRQQPTPRGGSGGALTQGHQAQRGGSDSVSVHTDCDEMPTRRQDAGAQVCAGISGYGPPVRARHKGAWLRGNCELKSSPYSAPQAFPWRKRQRWLLPVWPSAHGWLLLREAPISKSSIHSEGMPFLKLHEGPA